MDANLILAIARILIGVIGVISLIITTVDLLRKKCSDAQALSLFNNLLIIVSNKASKFKDFFHTNVYIHRNIR